MSNFYTSRLQGTLAQYAAGAAAQGLTEDELQRLLADERRDSIKAASPTLSPAPPQRHIAPMHLHPSR
jgi:hypothetical protein